MSSNAGLILPFIQGAAVNPRRFVKFDGNGNIVQAGANDPTIIGVSDQVGNPEAGKRVDVRMTGTAEVEAGAAFVHGTRVTSDSDGKAVPAVADDAATIALSDAGQADDHAEVLVCIHKV